VGPFKNLSNPVVSLVYVLFCGIGQRFAVDREQLSLHIRILKEIFPKIQCHAQEEIKRRFERGKIDWRFWSNFGRLYEYETSERKSLEEEQQTVAGVKKSVKSLTSELLVQLLS